MKKLRLLTILVAGLSFIALSGNASAVDILHNGTGGASSACTGADKASAVCLDNNTGKANPILGPNGLLTELTNLVLFIVGALAVIMIIISGIRMVTSAGDEAGFKSARTGLLYAVIGLIIAVAARAVVSFILSKL